MACKAGLRVPKTRGRIFRNGRIGQSVKLVCVALLMSGAGLSTASGRLAAPFDPPAWLLPRDDTWCDDRVIRPRRLRCRPSLAPERVHDRCHWNSRPGFSMIPCAGFINLSTTFRARCFTVACQLQESLI